MSPQPDDRLARFVRDYLLEVLLALAVVAIVYWWLAARYYAGEPTISRNIAAELNARVLAIPPQDRAWPLYVEALAKLEQLEDDPEIVEEDDLAETWFDLHPGDKLWPALTAYLDRNAEVLHEIRAATAKPAMGVILSDAPTADDVRIGWAKPDELREPSANPQALDLRLPHLGKARLMARLLRSDCRYALEKSDSTRATDDLVAMIGIAEHSREHGTTIGSLVSVAILSLVLEETMKITANHAGALTDADLGRLADRIGNLDDGGQVQFPMDGETLFFEDILQRTYTDDGAGDGHFTRAGWEIIARFENSNATLIEQYMFIAGATRAQSMTTWNNLMAAWERDRLHPAWKTDQLESEKANTALTPDFRSRLHLLEPLFNPAFTRIYQSLEMTEQLRTGTLIAIALERSRLSTGQYPASLAELVPKYLPEPPLDRFDGNTLRYVRRDGTTVLYSVGADGDDDGGAPAHDHDSYMRSRVWRSRAQRDRAPDADWVLWPPSAAHQ